jgi:putative spermidine/putrescine transport system substrate-binding protein
VRLWRGDRRLQGQVSEDHRQRTEPDAGSADEIEAIKANKDNKGPQAPDVIDVGLSFGPSAKAEGLIQPYKVRPGIRSRTGAKDAEGHWYGDYYGVLSFIVNKDLVPNRRRPTGPTC